MAKDEKVTIESRIISEDAIPAFLRTKLKRDVQDQTNNLEREYRAVLSSGNTDKAIELLIELIYTDDNTPKRREELRGLYSKQCPAGEDAIEYGYLKVLEVRGGINDTSSINGAKRDYIDYLQLQAQKYDYDKDFDDNAISLARKISRLLQEEPDTQNIELIQWFTRSKDYDSAWGILENSTDNDLIQFAVKVFQIEYDKYKKHGNIDDNDYRRVTWILASLFKKVGNIEQAIPKFIECKDFRSAYELVDIHSTDSLQFAFDEFKGHDDNYAKVLNTMINRHAELEQMFTVTPFPRPDNFALKWFFLNVFYAIRRVNSLFGKTASLALIAVLGVTFFVIPEYTSLILLGIGIVVLGYDIGLYGKWISLHRFYAEIIAAVGDHPQMTSLKGKFSKNLSTEIGTHRKLCVVIILLLINMCMLGYVHSTQQSDSIQKTSAVQEKVVPEESLPLQTMETQKNESQPSRPSLGENWIKDANTDIYLWNPDPRDGESISWNWEFR